MTTLDYSLDKQNEVFEEAKAKGLVILSAKDNYLFCDIDNEDSRKRFTEIIETLDVVKDYVKAKSKSGNNHVVVKLVSELDFYERGYLQLMLGSDLKREYCNFKRFSNGEPFISNLFATADLVTKLAKKGWLDDLILPEVEMETIEGTA